MNPCISVILLTYNRPELLKRSMKCALAQEGVSYEVILVDNGSQDGITSTLCKEYANNNSNVRLVRLEQGNIGAGRNAGIENATGSFITFVDDDDYFDPDFLLFLYQGAIAHQADISICGCYFDFGGTLKDYYIFEGDATFNREQGVEELLKREKYNSANPCKLFQREIFDHVRYPETGKYDDIHTIYRLFAEARKVYVCGQPKYYFYKHAANNSGFIESQQLTPDILWEYLDAFHTRTSYLSKRLPSIAARVQYSEWSYMLSMIQKIEQFHLTSCDKPLAYMKQVIRDCSLQLKELPYITAKEKAIVSHILTEPSVPGDGRRMPI